MKGHPNEELLEALADGELSRRRRLRLERHLASCASCRRVVEGWKRFHAEMEGAAPSPPAIPDGAFFRTTVLRRIREDAGDREPGNRSIRWIPVLVPAAAVLLFGFWIVAGALGIHLRGKTPDAVVSIELEDPSIVPMVDVRADGIPVVWFVNEDDDEGMSPPG